MDYPKPNITVNLDITNPGQFFACCGLLELADRLWPGGEGWFSDDDQQFLMAVQGSLSDLVSSLATAKMTPVIPEDPYSSPFTIGAPFRDYLIDWWKSDTTGARDLKVWAGTMESVGIALAMQSAIKAPKFHGSDLFNIGMVVLTDGDKDKKEPYYFDSRRAPNSHSRDIGFSPNDIKMKTIAHPAVELLCIIGLQGARPRPTATLRVYDYFTWHHPLMANLLMPASTGALQPRRTTPYRFENWFRTGQKKHKTFRSATHILEGD